MSFINSPLSGIILRVISFTILNEVVSGICAILYLWSQNWFGKGDLPSFLYYGVAHSLIVGIFSYLNSRVLTMKKLFLRLLCIIPIGIFLAFGWTLAMSYLLLGPMISAISIPIFNCWLISGALTLSASTVIDRRKENKSRIQIQESKRQEKFGAIYFSLFLLLPLGLVGVYWIFLYIGIYWMMLFSWEFKEGAIMSSGTSSCMLMNKGMYLTSESGYRRVSVSKLQPISIYHALIVKSHSGFISISYNSDGPKSQEIFAWTSQVDVEIESQKEKRQKLVIELHTVDSTVKIGNSEFNLVNGNFFLFKIDSSDSISANQFPIHNYIDSECVRIIEQFNSVLEGKIEDYPLIINPRELKEKISPQKS